MEALPGQAFIDRTTVNAWDDPRVAEAIRATGRHKLIFMDGATLVGQVRAGGMRVEQAHDLRSEGIGPWTLGFPGRLGVVEGVGPGSPELRPDRS